MRIEGFLACALFAHIGKREVGGCVFFLSHIPYAVAALTVGVGLEVFAQPDIWIHRIVLRAAHLLVPVEVEGDVDTPVFGQEFAQFEVHCRLHLQCIDQLERGGFLLQIAEARSTVGAIERQIAEVGKVGACQRHSCPAAPVVEVGETQLVNPHHAGLRHHVVAIVQRFFLGIAHTNHDDFHFAQVGGAQHGVFPAVGHFAVQKLATIGEVAVADKPVAVGLDIDEFGEVYLDVVFARPDGIGVVFAHTPGGEFERYFVFVVITGIVASETYKEDEVVILHGRGLRFFLGMDKHL